jgi:parallel beta-helix repeat protein
MSGNTYNFGVTSYHDSERIHDKHSYYTHKIDASNTVDGKPIYYWVNQQDQEIPDDAGYVGVVNCTNITVRGLTLTNNDQGVLFVCTNNSRIENVNVSNTNYGIILLESCDNNLLTENTADSNRHGGISTRYSSNNTLTNNIASSNNDHGICLSSSSDNNTLLNNTASNNSGNGIYLVGSSNNNITNNIINSNSNYGIGLKYIHFGTSSNNNSLVNNAVSNNSYGIYLASSSNNVLTGNNASNNDCGIMMWGSNNNTITCNLVQNNTDRGFYIPGNTNNNISYNNVIKNGNYNTSTGGWEWQFYNDQPEAIDAKHNYWGAGMNNSTIDASIYDDEEGGWGKVEFYPFETEPAPCAPTPEESHTFTTTDAVIALQIAVGSRPPDLRWDVSGAMAASPRSTL